MNSVIKGPSVAPVFTEVSPGWFILQLQLYQKETVVEVPCDLTSLQSSIRTFRTRERSSSVMNTNINFFSHTDVGVSCIC